MAHLFEDNPPPITTYARVALEQGIDTAPHGLTYAVPPPLGSLCVGDRVVVPLGRRDRPVAGHVVWIGPADDPASGMAGHGGGAKGFTSSSGGGTRIKPILERDRHGVSLPQDLVRLARWMAGYYCCPLGMVLASMLPAPVRRGTGTKTHTWVSLPTPTASNPASNPGTPAPAPGSMNPEAAVVLSEGGDSGGPSGGPSGGGKTSGDMTSEASGGGTKLTKLQTAIYATARDLAAQGRLPIRMKRLADLAGARTLNPVKQLVDKGLLASERRAAVEPLQGSTLVDDLAQAPPQPPIQLTADQERVLKQLSDSAHRGFGVHLLHGVTASGKTEVYLRWIEHVLNRSADPKHTRPTPPAGQDGDEHSPDRFDPSAPCEPLGAIVLVPEIALTHQTITRFVERFGAVAVLHSGLTPAQRHQQWLRVRRGRVRVVVGARSAVFAPLPRVGVIVVDEEHEPSYKQDQLPRYHARDVAIKRAQDLGIPVLLGSATPSLESYHNATAPVGRKSTYHLLKLPTRVTSWRLPTVQIIDMAAQRRLRRGVHLLSQPLERQLQQTAASGGQALLLLNRRGYANYIACPDHRCGWQMNCEYCDVMVVYHKDQHLRSGGFVRCHHCQAEQLLPAHCPLCGKRVTVFGLGTQRVEEELGTKFPGLRVIRMDSDTMHTSHHYRQSLDAFRRGDADLLVGTQMIAKGLDFPNVQLVGVICADTCLHMPDFRAAERTFQLVSQVAGRAGRTPDSRAVVIVQSFCPQDPAIVLASRHDYEGFAARELPLRQEVGLPPYTRMARIVVRDQDPQGCEQRAGLLADHLHAFNRSMGSAVQLRGPVPCPIARIASYHRRQIELIAPDAATLQQLMTGLRNARVLHADAHTAVDVDPVDLL